MSLTDTQERAVIVRWLRGLAVTARRCIGEERAGWYEGLADDLEHGNVTLDALRRAERQEHKDAQAHLLLLVAVKAARVHINARDPLEGASVLGQLDAAIVAAEGRKS